MLKLNPNYKKGAISTLLGLLIIAIVLGGGVATFLLTRQPESPPEKPPANGQPSTTTTPENGDEQPPTNGQPPTLETIKAIGTIEKLEISTWMYGTHTLSENDQIKYALTSEVVDLNQYLNKTVEVEGTLKEGYPVDGGPPYLIVEKIRIKPDEEISSIKERILQKTNIKWEVVNIDSTKALSVSLARAKPQTSSEDTQINQAKARETAIAFLELLQEELSIKDISETFIDEITAAFTVTYHQNFNNVPVYYSFGQISMTNYGDIYRLKHSWYPNITAPTTPKISESEIKQRARIHYKTDNIDFFEEPKLYILPPDKLVWLVKMAEPVHKDALIDALTGEVISEYENVVSEN